MRVLVTWATKMQGTAGIAGIIAEEVRASGHEVSAMPTTEVTGIERYDAIVVGGALYANRWHKDARRFVWQHSDRLRRVPVWFFSSGPLDESAEHQTIAPTRQVSMLMEHVGARGHMTFGGRLPTDARGVVARAMAAKQAGDWRNADQIRRWAKEICDALPTARPGVFVEHPAHSRRRLLSHGLIGWAACGTLMAALLALASTRTALVVHGISAPLIFIALSWHYFSAPGAREPLETALTFTAIVAGLDLLVVAGAMQKSLTMFKSLTGTWLPFLLIFAATYLTGAMFSTLPWARVDQKSRA